MNNLSPEEKKELSELYEEVKQLKVQWEELFNRLKILEDEKLLIEALLAIRS
jgi:hypothetical protein